MIWNPWKAGQDKAEAREHQKEEADYNLAQQAIGNPGEPQLDQAMIDRKDVLIQLSQWQQDRSPVIKKLFLELSGYTVNTKNGLLEKVKWNKGHLSLYGAHKLVSFIEPLDHNVMLANWRDKNLIITLRDSISHPLRRYIFQNHKELSLELEHAEYVFWSILNTIEPNYWRGWNDGERRKDREIIKVNEMRNPYFQDKKKGIFGVEG